MQALLIELLNCCWAINLHSKPTYWRQRGHDLLGKSSHTFLRQRIMNTQCIIVIHHKTIGPLYHYFQLIIWSRSTFREVGHSWKKERTWWFYHSQVVHLHSCNHKYPAHAQGVKAIGSDRLSNRTKIARSGDLIKMASLFLVMVDIRECSAIFWVLIRGFFLTISKTSFF